MINIITALPCEARALIDHYRLQGNRRHNAFRCYQNDELQLIISGVGKIAAAIATTFLAASAPQRCSAWLNLGIAGHPHKPVGEPLFAHKIIDAATAQSFYPGIILSPPCPTAPLTTVDTPEQHYRENTMVDMEASGFYAAASRFQSCELIHSLKIISDNQAHSTDHITEKTVTAFIADNLNTIDAIITALQPLAVQLENTKQPPAELYAFMERWRFTAYQQNELRLLLRRWHALALDIPPDPRDFTDYKNGKAILIAIKDHLDAQPIRFEQASH